MVEKVEQKIDLKYLIPYTAGILIFLGVTRLIIFYSYFHINILPFLQIGEIVTSFFDFLVPVVYYISITYVFIKITYIFLTKSVPFWIVLSLMTIVYILLFTIVQKQIQLSYVEVLQPLFMVIIIVAFVYRMLKDTLNHSFTLNGIIAVFCICGIIAIWLVAKDDVYDIKKRKQNFGVKVIFNDPVPPFVSDSNNYYIGQTTNYIFLHNQINSKTRAIKVENIKEIEFPSAKPDGQIGLPRLLPPP